MNQFSFFSGIFYDFWYAKDDKITYSGDVSEQGDMQKRQFPKDGIRRVFLVI